MVGEDLEEHRAGMAVDVHGGPVNDPTRNVGDLVKAESKYQDAMRVAIRNEFIAIVSGLRDTMKLMAESAASFQNAQREAETKRIDQLAATRQEFMDTIRDMLAASVQSTSTLVSTQLVQIQATFDTRVAKLEAYQFTQAGRSSVADPQLAQSLGSLTHGMTDMQTAFSKTLNDLADRQAATMSKMALSVGDLQMSGSKGSAMDVGRREVFAWILAGITTLLLAVPILSHLAIH